MKYKEPLLEGDFIKRYKRFFADIEWVNPATKKSEVITIHVPNTGSLKSVIQDNPSQKQKCLFTLNNDPEKKLKGTLHALQVNQTTWVGVNTSYPNKIVLEAAENSIETGKAFFSHWSGYGFYKNEFKISKETRLDGVFVKEKKDLESESSKKHFIEIKNTTLVKVIDGKRHAQFPDAVTERGQKHLVELTELIKKGHQAELIFTIQRNDVDVFSVAEDIDADYAKLFAMAVKSGLIVTPVVVNLTKTEISLSKKVLSVES